MTRNKLILTSPDSDLSVRVQRASGETPLQLSLDAAFTENAITIATAYGNAGHADAFNHLRWQGHTLIDEKGPRFDRILVERPLFSWPQPWCDRVPPLNPEEAALEVERLHAARSLTISALRVLEDNAVVANRPSLALLAATPAIALARLQRAGIAVHPWSCDTSGEPVAQQTASMQASSSGLESPMRTPALLGRERWIASSPKETNSVQVIPGLGAGPLEEVLVVGNEVVAGGRNKTTTEHALGAVKALDLVFAAITLDQETGKVAWVDTAPDLDFWDRNSSGKVATALAQWLYSPTPSLALPQAH